MRQRRRSRHQPGAPDSIRWPASNATCRRPNGARCRTTPSRSIASCATLREGIMRVRLVPIGEIFRRMPFVVRDLARESGKKVALELAGPVDRDRQVPDRAHDGSGAPPRAQRGQPRHRTARRIGFASGKRPEGTITLSAATAGELVTIEIADDGRGVDADAVAARARAAGPAGPRGHSWMRRRCSTLLCCARLLDQGRRRPRQRARRRHGGGQRRPSNSCRAR